MERTVHPPLHLEQQVVTNCLPTRHCQWRHKEPHHARTVVNEGREDSNIKQCVGAAVSTAHAVLRSTFLMHCLEASHNPAGNTVAHCRYSTYSGSGRQYDASVC